MPFAFSPAFEAFVAPARARSGLWRVVAGVLLAGAVWVGAVLVLFGGGLPGVGARGFLLLYLASFAGLGLGTVLAARLLHGRGAGSLVGPGGVRPRGFAAGVGVVAAVGLVVTVGCAVVAPPVRQVGFGEWTRLLPLALGLVLVQTAAEELLFRGYLMQALAARFRSPLVWALVPALAFGALHWDGGAYGGDAWLAVAAATAVGLAFADVTAVTGNLSAAMGLHFANNVLALLVVAMPGETAALALWVSPVDAEHPMRAWLVVDVATTLVAWGGWRLACTLRGRRLHSRGRGSI